jgi:hypothetical protein
VADPGLKSGVLLFLHLNYAAMNLKKRCEAFAELGSLLRKTISDIGRGEKTDMDQLIRSQYNKNQWFTSENVIAAISAVADELTPGNLEKWTSMYPELENSSEKHNVGVIMAGNIPLVGFHDFLCVLITGNKLIARTSSKDSDLIVYISELLCSINNEFREMINFTEGTLTGFDAVIATGSNNTSRYFEYYFGKYPHIIRKNRNSIAILDGTETYDEIKELGKDIFSYFGLGCRNVSKIYLPEGYDIANLTRCWNDYSPVAMNSKYANNYDYYKAIFLVNREPFTDTGYLLMKEDKKIASPVAVLYYEYFSTYGNLIKEIKLIEENIQCTVSKNHTPFGQAQKPALWEYADGIDTIEFLLKKKSPGRL